MNFPSLTSILLTYLVLVNVFTFFVFGIDKWKASRGAWRIPEATLLCLAAIGGSIGAWLGMRTWHHKTQHKKFIIGVPVIFLFQLFLIYLFARVIY